MLNALIPIELNLASNIALRYACRRSGLLDAGLQPIHVEEPDGKAHSSQSGWIRRTWEAGMEEAGREEVQRILNTEKPDCFVAPRPIIAVGDRNETILEELQRGGYDLFIEGVVSNFNLGEFRRLLRSRLYRRMGCPVLMVKNLILSPRVLLLLEPAMDVDELVEEFCRLLPHADTDFDLRVCDMNGQHGEGAAGDVLRAAAGLLASRGRRPARSDILHGSPESVAAGLRDYGLLVSAVDRSSSRRTPLVEVLGRVPCPLLLCWQHPEGRSK